MDEQHVLQVSAGSGPVEVRHFVRLLAERLALRCAALGLAVNATVLRGEEVAPRSVELWVAGDARRLGDELGTHALVARSAERGRAARKRWYAAVALHRAREGMAGASGAAMVKAEDLEVQASRSGGPGGQNVNKVATAVRVWHRPSGLVVRVAAERSQRANLALAVERIARTLAAQQEGARKDAVAERRRAHYRVERGRPVRVYRLSPKGELREEG
jgi:protein subunit release factor B